MRSRQRQTPMRAFHPRFVPQDAIGLGRSMSVLSRARSNNGTTAWRTASGSGSGCAGDHTSVLSRTFTKRAALQVISITKRRTPRGP